MAHPHYVLICDTIKGNESHVGNIQFWVFNTDRLSILNATIWSKPDLNRASGCGEMNILWSLKTMKNIRICHLFKPVTQNQYSPHPTHSPWSCHISKYPLPQCCINIFLKKVYFRCQILVLEHSSTTLVNQYWNTFGALILFIAGLFIWFNRLVSFIEWQYWNRNMVQYHPIHTSQYLRVKELKSTFSVDLHVLGVYYFEGKNKFLWQRCDSIWSKFPEML